MVKKIQGRRRTQKKKGAGFFNFFTKKHTNTNTGPIRKSTIPKYPPRGYTIKNTTIKNTSFEPLLETKNINRQFFPDYESYKEASERMFAYIYQKYKQVPYNSKKLLLTRDEKRELRTAILQTLNQLNYTTGKQLNTATSKLLMKKLFNLLTDEDIDEFNREYKEVEATVLNGNKKPLMPFTYFFRLLPAFLKTDREMEYTSNQEKYLCAQRDYATNTTKTLNSDECIMIVRSIPALYKNIISNELVHNIFYMVLHPLYFPVGKERYQSKTFNTSINSKSNETVSIVMKTIGNISFVNDAFENGGLQLIHPRLGILIQEQLPNLWNKSCFVTKNSKNIYGRNIDLADRIIILTLQKYAAIRRYMWTKNPQITADIYKVNPISISNELRDPSKVLPKQAITSENQNSMFYDVLQKIPTYSAFNEREFLKEFIENQIWATGKVKYKSMSDPGLNAILPKNPNYWTIPAAFSIKEMTEIPLLPEQAEILKNINKNINNN